MSSTSFTNSAVPAPRPSLARVPVTDDYVDFCEGVRRLCGIDLGQYKRGQMERRVRAFVERRQDDGNLATYLTTLRGDGDEVDAFLDRVTINVSQLWRNPEQWERVQRKIIPELVEGQRSFKAWSAGCSYGAEALTLAAIAREAAPSVRIEIDGTDIDARVVERARRGHFSEADARDAPSAALKRWFDVAPDGGWQARPELVACCHFEVADLLRTPARPNQYDLVLCRNTVIYFTDEVRDALHARLAASVRPGGYFMIGSTERVTDPRAVGLEPAYPFTYRKTES